MATFTAVTSGEMDSFLSPQGFSRVELPGTVELVYGKRVDIDGLALSLRVYTGINPNGASREKGTDAIRCNLFWRRPDGEVRKVASSARVHRVEGWRSNLQKRLEAMTVERRCECGAPMVLRKSARGKFYGCAGFPECRKTAAV